jgi:putative flavoprotein involved in K+ transport
MNDGTIEFQSSAVPHVPAIVIGAGQAGLSVSHLLKQSSIEHLVFERHQIGHAWREERWDSFCLVTPNRQCRLPGFSYRGDDPHGFMPRDEIVAFIEAYAAFVQPPIHEGVTVRRVSRGAGDRYAVETDIGTFSADAVIVAIGGYHVPSTPRLSADIDPSILQMHSRDYRNPEQFPQGEILVVGSGQSGCQIAEDLHLAGRKVHLSVGDAPRSPRNYRGRDVTDWLENMGHYGMAIDAHPLGKAARRNENHYLTGRDGGREIDLRRFALQGMKLYGRLDGAAGTQLTFEPNLTAHLDGADRVYMKIRNNIDAYIARAGIAAPAAVPYAPVWQPDGDPTALDLAHGGVRSIVWSTGFRSEFGLVDVPVFDERGYPDHERGISAADGLYFIGLPWLHTWGSGRFQGVARDAEHIVSAVAGRLQRRLEASRRIGARAVPSR